MRFLHIADLHLGKALHGVSLLENGDQGFWCDRFLALADRLAPDAVVIAGDVYDRSSPAGDAVALLSRLLTALAERGVPVMLVAGNHDSGQRLSFAAPLLARQDLHIAGTARRALDRVTLTDEHGPVTFWLLPYLFPALAAQLLGDESIRDYDAAVRRILAAQDIDPSERNVIVAHQNVTRAGVEAPRGGSETMVGGVGAVDCTAFDAFDYAALGHIHAACAVGREAVRYAGSPLCYHFDELRQPPKGPVLVTLGPKGTPVRTETFALPPLHPLREFRGALAEVQEAVRLRPDRGEYVRVVLSDQPLTPEIAAFFRDFFAERDSVLMELRSEYDPFTGAAGVPTETARREKSVEELFADFYAERSGAPPEPEELALLRAAGELLRRGEGLSPADAAGALLRAALEQEADR